MSVLLPCVFCRQVPLCSTQTTGAMGSSALSCLGGAGEVCALMQRASCSVVGATVIPSWVRAVD